jgi:hypothetical protein
MKFPHPPGPPMTLGNMREQGVHHPIAYCLNGRTGKSNQGCPTAGKGARLGKSDEQRLMTHWRAPG